MQRDGVVINLNDDVAKVVLRRHAACGDCGACQMGEENMNVEVDALNKLFAKVGDSVTIDMETPNVLRASFIAYGIPLFVLVLAVVVTQKIGAVMGLTVDMELLSLIVGVVAMFITFGVIRTKEKDFKEDKRYLSQIISINK